MKLRSLNNNNRKFVNDVIRGKTNYSVEEDDFIIENYLKMPIKRMAKIMNRSFPGITGRLKHYNLEIPKEIIENRKLNSRRKKGDAPFNKGMKQIDYMSQEAIERTKTTRFKKGNIPHNSIGVEIGCIRVRTDYKQRKGCKYQWIKVSDNEWKLLHHFVWESVYGPKPENGILRFKDGNTMNCSIDNIELIDFKTNMILNTIHRYPDELQRSFRLLKKLKRTIKI
ncbi:HNH endonuclease signature motif containing protein [Lutibacter sp.]|uniref:HNH endonuclease signature motif containing protein n=1 Tax=Lutibacter sp. TaxID=1925666 RepID=UPI0035622AF7